MKYFLRPTVCIQVCALVGAPPSTRVCQPGHRHRGDSGLGALRQAGLGAGGVGPGAGVPWGRQSSDCQDWGLALILGRELALQGPLSPVRLILFSALSAWRDWSSCLHFQSQGHGGRHPRGTHVNTQLKPHGTSCTTCLACELHLGTGCVTRAGQQPLGPGSAGRSGARRPSAVWKRRGGAEALSPSPTRRRCVPSACAWSAWWGSHTCCPRRSSRCATQRWKGENARDGGRARGTPFLRRLTEWPRFPPTRGRFVRLAEKLLTRHSIPGWV